MIWIVIGMMVYWSIFCWKWLRLWYVNTVQICCSISHPTFHISKNPSVTRCSIWCKLTNFSLNFKNRNSKFKQWIPVILSITVTCCTNIHIFICNPLKMEFLQLLWKFHGYIFNGLGEKWIWKLSPEILPIDLKHGTGYSSSAFLYGYFSIGPFCTFFNIYSMFHVTWTTFSFNRTHLGMVSSYIMWLWQFNLLMPTLEWLHSIETQCRKRFHLKPKTAISYTEISLMICKTILIFSEHKRKEGWGLSSRLMSVCNLLSVVLQWNYLESNFLPMTYYAR